MFSFHALVAGFQPLCVVDAWEHGESPPLVAHASYSPHLFFFHQSAYVLDFGASGRPKYIEAIFKVTLLRLTFCVT